MQMVTKNWECKIGCSCVSTPIVLASLSQQLALPLKSSATAVSTFVFVSVFIHVFVCFYVEVCCCVFNPKFSFFPLLPNTLLYISSLTLPCICICISLSICICICISFHSIVPPSAHKKQTWDLSKKLYDQIFGPEILHTKSE